jgi:hypothetical protein
VVQIGLQRTAAAGQDGTRAAALLAEAADHAGPGTVWTRRVEARRESDGLLRAAEVERPVLMVVGARGRSALGAALLGSVSAELPLRASCPVMVLPPQAPVPRFSTARGLRPTIVCGVVDSEDGQSAARIAGELARALDARLHLPDLGHHAGVELFLPHERFGRLTPRRTELPVSRDRTCLQ